MTNLAEWIKENRKQCGLSQHEIADRVGVKQSLVSMWESGAQEPRVRHIAWLFVIFKTTDAGIAEFFRWDEHFRFPGNPEDN